VESGESPSLENLVAVHGICFIFAFVTVGETTLGPRQQGGRLVVVVAVAVRPARAPSAVAGVAPKSLAEAAAAALCFGDLDGASVPRCDGCADRAIPMTSPTPCGTWRACSRAARWRAGSRPPGSAWQIFDLCDRRWFWRADPS
jgi:hypothetical protein